jgi:serine/threonine-protein kinase RsbW
MTRRPAPGPPGRPIDLPPAAERARIGVELKLVKNHEQPRRGARRFPGVGLVYISGKPAGPRGGIVMPGNELACATGLVTRSSWGFGRGVGRVVMFLVGYLQRAAEACGPLGRHLDSEGCRSCLPRRYPQVGRNLSKAADRTRSAGGLGAGHRALRCEASAEHLHGECASRGSLMAGRASPPGPAVRLRRVFPGREDQVRLVRRFVTGVLADYPGRDDVALCATELATNAIRHTASGRGGVFATELTWARTTIRLAVADAGAPTGPVIGPHDPGLLDEAGRGLTVVAGLSDSYGAEGDHRGRVVWAQFRSAPRTPAPPAPERTSPQPATQTDAVAPASCTRRSRALPAVGGREWANASCPNCQEPTPDTAPSPTPPGGLPP